MNNFCIKYRLYEEKKIIEKLPDSKYFFYQYIMHILELMITWYFTITSIDLLILFLMAIRLIYFSFFHLNFFFYNLYLYFHDLLLYLKWKINKRKSKDMVVLYDYKKKVRKKETTLKRMLTCESKLISSMYYL